MKKALIVRFSSIGDIVLTTPVIRSLKRARPEIELHFATRRSYADALAGNPWLDGLRLYDEEGGLDAFVDTLRPERYDSIIDLHCNPRSMRLAWKLGVKRYGFPKRNFAKLRMTAFKNRSLAVEHIVERYGFALRPLGVGLDAEGLEFHITPEARREARALIASARFSIREKPVSVTLAGTYFTKRWPTEYFIELVKSLKQPVILLGGKSEAPAAAQIQAALPRRTRLLNAVGQASLGASAALLDASAVVLAHDTGLMHIAAALKKPIALLWGNTTPRFGMGPYRTRSIELEVEALACRPCDKLGRSSCPEGHFRCMRDIEPPRVQAALAELTRPPGLR